MKLNLFFLMLAIGLANRLECQIVAQEKSRATSTNIATSSKEWADLERLLVWPHIGAPPPHGASKERLTQWRGEDRFFTATFAVIKSSWTEDPEMGAVWVRRQVERYDSLFLKVSGATGYGNVVLGDCLRRLSLSSLLTFLVRHPSEYAAVADLLGRSAALQVDSRAIQSMLVEELGVTPKGDVWRLADDKAELDSVFRACGTTTNEAFQRSPWAPMRVSDLMRNRDVAALLTRLVDADLVARVGLPGLFRFLSRGGRITDLSREDTRPFSAALGLDRFELQFKSLGINAVTAGRVLALVEAFRSEGNQMPSPLFTRMALE